MHCGRMIVQIVWRRVKASDSRRLPLRRSGSTARRRARSRPTFAITGKREPEHRLQPVRQRDDACRTDPDLERQQEHREEQQHQPRRVAEELRHRPGAPAHRPAAAKSGTAPAPSRAPSRSPSQAKLIRMLNPKPRSSSGVHFASAANTLERAAPAPCASATPALSSTRAASATPCQARGRNALALGGAAIRQQHRELARHQSGR